VGRVPDPLPEPLASTDYGVGSSPVRRDWVFVDVDECFVLGDNPERSADSRCYGVVPLRNIKGVVYKIFWPLDRAGPVDR
jgi:signal peptidase I